MIKLQECHCDGDGLMAEGFIWINQSAVEYIRPGEWMGQKYFTVAFSRWLVQVLPTPALEEATK